MTYCSLAPTLSLVLLSHSSSNYLSLYPYARGRWGLTCPVYATQPTVEMGRVVCLAEAESWRAECPVESEDVAEDDGSKKPLKGPFVPTVEEVHEAFDWIKAVRYSQPLHLGGQYFKSLLREASAYMLSCCSGDFSHLLLTPFASGHTLGGSLFKIRSPTSGTVLYAVGVNHTSERHLDGMVGVQNGPTGYADGVLRPDLLIAEGGRSMVVNPKRKEREAALIGTYKYYPTINYSECQLDTITSTLESNHSVLLPVDPSPRLLELMILLDQHWTFKRTPKVKQQRYNEPPADLWPYPLCVVSKTAQDMVAFARSLIDWMGGVVKDSAGDMVDVGRGKRARGARMALGSEYGVLDFRHVLFFLNTTDLLQTYPLTRPKLVLAVPPTMSHGPSRFLFTAMANTEGNVIMLTGRSEEQTLARDLYNRWERSQTAGSKWGEGKIGHLTRLEGKLQVEVSAIPV